MRLIGKSFSQKMILHTVHYTIVIVYRDPERWERWERVPRQFEILAAILADDSHTFIAK